MVNEAQVNFGGLAKEFSAYEKAKVVILPMGFGGTVSYGSGTEHGPEAIIQASMHMELFDIELQKDISQMGICSIKQPSFSKDAEKVHEVVYASVKKILDDKKFPVMLGGEHAISSGMARALKEKYPKLSVLQVDAHSDLRDKYAEPPAHPSVWSHACVMKRIRDMGIPTVAVGIRSQCDEEVALVKKEKIPMFYAKDMVDNDAWMGQAIKVLSDHVFITFDIDAFDPSIMPATGTPEPGGLQWYQTLRFLRKVAEKKTIVGFDVVELSPIKGLHHADFLAALLVYKLIGYSLGSKVLK